MELQNLRDSLRGVIAFMPTAMRPDGSLDVDGQRAHAGYLAGSGVAAIVVAGGVGEFYALESDEYTQLVRESVDAVAGAVPVLAGVGHSTAIAAALAARAAGAGAAGLMVNPLYFVRPERAGLLSHYRDIGAASGLGLIVFSTTGSVYDVADLEDLAQVEAVVAVKDEVGDLGLFSRCVATVGDRYVWINGMAEQPAVDYAELGAVAMTSGLVNLDPQLTLDIWAAALAGDRAGHDRIVTERVGTLAELRQRRPGYHITVLKEAMHLLGRGGSTVRLPLVPIDDASRAELAAHLERAGFMDAA